MMVYDIGFDTQEFAAGGERERKNERQEAVEGERKEKKGRGGAVVSGGGFGEVFDHRSTLECRTMSTRRFECEPKLCPTPHTMFHVLGPVLALECATVVLPVHIGQLLSGKKTQVCMSAQVNYYIIC